MSEIDQAKAQRRDKRLDRIEALLEGNTAKVDRSSDSLAERLRRNDELIAENKKTIAETAKLIAENAKGLAELKKEMAWRMPLKSGLWTLAFLLIALIVINALPKAASAIMHLLGVG